MDRREFIAAAGTVAAVASASQAFAQTGILHVWRHDSVWRHFYFWSASRPPSG
jgi:hypothetical protein